MRLANDETVMYNISNIGEFCSMAEGVSRNVDDQIEQLSKLITDLGAQSWTSEGGAETVGILKNFVNSDLNTFATKLQSKCKDFRSVEGETSSLNKVQA